MLEDRQITVGTRGFWGWLLPLTTSTLGAWLRHKNDAADFTTASAAPLVIVAGAADTLVIPSSTGSLAAQLCRLDPPQNLERWLYAGLDHAGIVGDQQLDGTPAIGDYVAWTEQRFAGTPRIATHRPACCFTPPRSPTAADRARYGRWPRPDSGRVFRRRSHRHENAPSGVNAAHPGRVATHDEEVRRRRRI